MREYKVFDIRGGLMADDTVVAAKSPIEAVRTLYDNVRRVKNGDIVVNHRFCYDGDKKRR